MLALDEDFKAADKTFSVRWKKYVGNKWNTKNSVQRNRRCGKKKCPVEILEMKYILS